MNEPGSPDPTHTIRSPDADPSGLESWRNDPANWFASEDDAEPDACVAARTTSPARLTPPPPRRRRRTTAEETVAREPPPTQTPPEAGPEGLAMCTVDVLEELDDRAVRRIERFHAPFPAGRALIAEDFVKAIEHGERMRAWFHRRRPRSADRVRVFHLITAATTTGGETSAPWSRFVGDPGARNPMARRCDSLVELRSGEFGVDASGRLVRADSTSPLDFDREFVCTVSWRDG